MLRQLFMRMRKFSDIQQALGITKHRLTDRLNRLIEEEIVYKHLYDENYNRYEYRLTEKGIDLYSVLIVIGQWGDKWMADNDGPPVQYIHKDCGQDAKPVLCCSSCGGKLTPTNISAHMGPGIEKKLNRDDLAESDMKVFSNLYPDAEKQTG